MLSNAYFYHNLSRKYIILFGNLFNRILMKRVDPNTGAEIERINIPLLYATKEKYVTRLNSDPTLNKETAVTLPRMSFEMTGMAYNPTRKQISSLKVAKGNSATGVNSQYMSVPYDLTFELNIYARNVDDGYHIVEQILPYFNPTYTPSVNLIPEIGLTKDIPIILNSVVPQVTYEGDFDSVRYAYWTLSFTMLADYWGPVSTPKIIRKVITNFLNDPSLQAGYVIRINTTGGNNGDYKLNDIAYQGDDYDKATAYAQVFSWSANTGKLVLVGAQGQFKTNGVIRAATTNANYTLHSFDANPITLARITIEPDPLTALPNSDYGYTTTIAEWPNT